MASIDETMSPIGRWAPKSRSEQPIDNQKTTELNCIIAALKIQSKMNLVNDKRLAVVASNLMRSEQFGSQTSNCSLLTYYTEISDEKT